MKFLLIALSLLGLGSKAFAEEADAYLETIFVSDGLRNDAANWIDEELRNYSSPGHEYGLAIERQLAAQAAISREKAERSYQRYIESMRRTGHPPQPNLTPEQQQSRDRIGRRLLEKSQESVELRKRDAPIGDRLPVEERRLKDAYAYLDKVGVTNRIQRTRALDMADRSLDLAKAEHDPATQKSLTNIGGHLIDFAMGMGAGLAVDIVQAISGKHWRTRDKLSDFDYWTSVGGAVVGVATFGASSALINGGKALVNIARKMYRAGHVGDLQKATEVIGESLNAGRGIFGNLPKVGREALTEGQSKNLKRFEKKLPAGSNPTTLHKQGEAVIFQGEVPGNVPGSKAVYEKAVDDSGKTLIYMKTTYTPDGKIVHIKDKVDGSVVFPE